MEAYMHKVLILVPFAFDEKGLANRRAQQDAVELGPDVQFDYRPVKAGPARCTTAGMTTSSPTSPSSRPG
jgi:hypothetical protein